MFRSKKFTIFIVLFLFVSVVVVWRLSDSNFEFLENMPNGALEGKVNIGPFCPVERLNSPCPVPPSAYSSRQVLVYQNDGKTVIARVAIGSDGHYSLSLAPGNYLVRVSPAGIGEMSLQKVVISSSKITKLDFNIDTGIR